MGRRVQGAVGVMAKHDPSLSDAYHAAKRADLILHGVVAVEVIEPDGDFKGKPEWFEYLTRIDTPGRFSYTSTPIITSDGQPITAMIGGGITWTHKHAVMIKFEFHITDPEVAFEFRLRFGGQGA